MAHHYVPSDEQGALLRALYRKAVVYSEHLLRRSLAARAMRPDYREAIGFDAWSTDAGYCLDRQG